MKASKLLDIKVKKIRYCSQKCVKYRKQKLLTLQTHFNLQSRQGPVPGRIKTLIYSLTVDEVTDKLIYLQK